VIYAGLADQLDSQELSFVLGHEMGHIQNQHVVYMTLLRMLTQGLGLFTRWAVRPAELALSAWSRSAEVTCDRAGLLCCGDLQVATRALVKIACGSRQLYEQLNLDSYLSQLRDGRDGIGRFGELLASHPYIPKRVQALHVFAQSELFRRRTGLGEGGLSLQEVDRRTAEVMRIAVGGDA
jgi:Zn-dependent protease with chaperone function